MAANPRSALARRQLSAEESRFYASVYDSARRGSLSELQSRGCHPEEAEEFFATAYGKVMEAVDPIAREFSAAQMVTFIKRATWRVMIDERRRRGQRTELEITSIQSGLSDPGAESPEEVAEEREAVAIGREALQTLSERDRRIFCQRHQLDLTPEEIVKGTPGLSRRTYRKIIERANSRVFAAFERIEAGERCEEMEASLLRRYVADECSEHEHAEVEMHLAHCRSCQLVQARMRGYLHDVAGGLAIAASVAGGDRLVTAAGLPVRLADLASGGLHGALDGGRAARERVRDLILRIAGGAPGAGGDATVGQALTATSLKVASACAATAVAGACVAAGVVPGIAGIGSGVNQHAPNIPSRVPKASARTHESSAPPSLIDQLPEAAPTSPSPHRKAAKRVSKRAAEKQPTSASSEPHASAGGSESAAAVPKELSEVSSGEFFDETATPASSSPPPSSSGSSGGSAPSGSGAQSRSSESEFGM
jgi:RNA polymerase sigma factor (sigma-70 family)